MEDEVQVLIVEDHPEVMHLLRAAFEDGGFAVLSVVDADQAIAAIDSQDHAIRALVTDVQLGSTLKGWEVARHARETYPAIPVVYTTGSEGRDWTSLGVPNSVLIEKPYAPSQVLTAVAQLLNAGTAPSA